MMNRTPFLWCAVLAIALSSAVADGQRSRCPLITGQRSAFERFADFALARMSAMVDYYGLAAVPDGTVDRDEGRGKKKKKIKNTMSNIMVGGSVMAAMVVMFTILNAVTVTLGKAFLFTFITKFLVAVNWKPGGSSSEEKKSPNHKDVTVLLE